MSKILWKSLLVGPAILGSIMAVSTSASAEAVSKNVSADSLAPESQQLQIAPSAQALVPSVAVASVTPETIAAPVFTPAQAPATASIPVPVVVSQAAPTESGAMEQVRSYSSEGRGSDAKPQVTSVSQLSDVQPTDWAFQALQSLVERYGCIAGYPDRTYRGNRALTRFEFAAGLNSCLDRVSELIAAGTADLVTKQDLAVLQRLQEEFAAELATLRGRVDALEARTATLEAQQFSTTTKLAGEAIFAVSDVFSGDNVSNAPFGNAVPNNNTILANRVRLNFNTSFTGQDLLVTRLQVGNALPFASPGGPQETFQTYEAGSSGQVFRLDTLNYTFPFGSNTRVTLEANAGAHNDYVPTVNPYFEDFDGGSGALSSFAQESPIYRLGSGSGAGAGFITKFGDSLSLSGGYLANVTGNNPGNTQGLFNGSYSALGQLTFTPSDAFTLALTYNNAYFTEAAQFGYGVSGTARTVGNTAGGLLLGNRVASDSYGAAASFKLSPNIVINGWATTTNARVLGVGDFNTWSYAVGVAFPDLGRKGNVLGIMVGVQPYVTGVRGGGTEFTGGISRDTPFHIEGFYKYQLTDNISITPGVIWLTAPNQNNNNNDIVIGTLRTTFLF